MATRQDRPIRKGDRGFLFRLLGGAVLVVVLAILVLGLLDKSRLGSCAARGFQDVTDAPRSD
jgi:hypothetical protein